LGLINCVKASGSGKQAFVLAERVGSPATNETCGPLTLSQREFGKKIT
jgi:hypothetical protein